MKVFLVSYLFLLSRLGIPGTQCAETVIDHYWKDYSGLLPRNAIPGGKDENGATTYLAQFTTVAKYNTKTAKLHTLPAVIQMGSKYAVAAYYGGSLKSDASSNTKILCYGSYSNNYKWYNGTSGCPAPPNYCDYVIAGFEDASPMYIGRVEYNKEILVGKIFANTTRLICPYNGREIHHNIYEVLTFCAALP